jgi:hypothetical protein
MCDVLLPPGVNPTAVKYQMFKRSVKITLKIVEVFRAELLWQAWGF